MGGGNSVQETPAQQALAEHANNLMADYQKRWAPVQQRMIETTQTMGREGSSAREAAAGRAGADVEARFGQAGQKLQAGLNTTGAGVGSSKAKLAMGGLSLDKAAAKGQNISLSDQAITGAYMQGLSSIAAMGRGERAQVNAGLADQANMSARQAAQDADISLQNRMGNAQLAGQAVGLGFSQARKPNGGAGVPSEYSPNGLRMDAPAQTGLRADNPAQSGLRAPSKFSW